MLWFDKPLNEVEQALKTDIKNGLSEDISAERLIKNGKNELTAKKSKTLLERFIFQFKDFMIIILILASIISAIIAVIEKGSFIDPIVIIFIVLLNAVLGVVQESKAEKALEALKNMSSPNAKVIRNGKVNSIKSTDLVLGDIVLIEAGDFIPADGRIIESAALKVEESALTGEAMPVEKSADFKANSNTPLAERKNMVFATTSVVYGRGRILITDTGMNTEVGKIADMLQNEEEGLTPLQKRLAQLGKYLGIIALSICAVIFIVGLIEQKQSVSEIFLIAVSLAVAAIPEGLPAIVTIVLAIGVQQMVKKHAIIRRLPAVETLGCASVICSDKTGTLTQNRMTVVKAYANGNIVELTQQKDEYVVNLLKLGTLCCDGRVEIVDGLEKHFGDPTETAIVAMALKYQLESLHTQYLRLGEIPFDSDRKMMTTIHNIEGRIIAIVKGAPDILFKLCKNNTELSSAANEVMAKDALRVLAVAFKELTVFPTEITSEQIENNLTLVGLIGMIDPPRDEAKIAVATCKKAGIRTVMITGDNITTASAIAKQLGILDDNGYAITGTELSNMSDKELYQNIHKYAVYARVSPEDKIRIIKAWQHNGQVVAMTGDGVNDAPALKGADIGCAMGITGTDVAKGAADMVLTDDNFATIVLAVREGRGIYNNILKTIQFLLGSNISEVLTVFVCMVVGFGAPLAAIQILWINLITDGLPALALGMEPIERGVMDEKPRPKNDSIFSNGIGFKIAWHGFMLGILAIIGYCIGHFEIIPTPKGLDKNIVAQTMAFGVIAFSQTFHAFNLRSNHSLFKVGLFSNKYMLGAFAVSSALLLGVMLIPPLATVFRVVPLSFNHWAIIIGLAFTTIIIVEFCKLLTRIYKDKKEARGKR